MWPNIVFDAEITIIQIYANSDHVIKSKHTPVSLTFFV